MAPNKLKNDGIVVVLAFSLPANEFKLTVLTITCAVVLFSIIVTLANFDIVRVLTRGGPSDSTHLFATYAFRVGIESGDIPLGASVSLFMFPVLAVLAFIILHNVRKRAMEI